MYSMAINVKIQSVLEILKFNWLINLFCMTEYLLSSFVFGLDSVILQLAYTITVLYLFKYFKLSLG